MPENNILSFSIGEQQELYQLTSGKIILDKEISSKMYKIVSLHPERSHPVSGTGYSWDETGMAELFAQCYENDTRYCPEAKMWYTYSEGAWRKDVGSLLVAEKIKEFFRIMVLYCGEITDEDRRGKYLKFIAKLGDRRFRERVMKDAASVNPIPLAKFDSNPYLINCLNGTYDLQEMIFREHDWRDYLTMQTDFEYTLQDVRCRRWIEFIDEVTEGNKEKALYLQKALGYSLLGYANEECMFICHGRTTRNGKSTLLNTINHLLGDYATVSPSAIICKPDHNKNAESANPMVASLKGKRFVTMQESNQYGKLDEEVIKSLTGGEEIKARQLYESPMTFTPQFTLWLSCNDLPAVHDRSLFASERIRIIEFNRHFSAEEQDKNLKYEFQEPKAMQGIFSWLVEGYFLYKRFGLTMPPDMQKIVNQYEKDNDLVLQFLEERCKRQKGKFTQNKDLYNAYKIWCKSNGYWVCSAKKFNAGMATHPEWHGGKIELHGYLTYKDIALKT